MRNYDKVESSSTRPLRRREEVSGCLCGGLCGCLCKEVYSVVLEETFLWKLSWEGGQSGSYRCSRNFHSVVTLQLFCTLLHASLRKIKFIT